jgi:hypothetical protein
MDFATRHESKPISIQNRRWDPITAVSSASITTVGEMADAAVGIFVKPYEQYKRGRLDTKSSHATNTERGATQPSRASQDDSASLLPKHSNAPQRKADIINTSTAKKVNLNTVGAMAASSATSFGKVFVEFSKGALVDIPVAAADGLRAVPQLYDHTVEDYGKVTDWKSGVVVATKNFGHGMYEGFTDIFVQTYHGKKKEGSAGVTKGLAKGLVGMTLKTTAGVVGLVAYPAQGVSKSIRRAMRSTTKTRIADAIFAEGEWLAKTEAASLVDHALLIAEFETMKGT